MEPFVVEDFYVMDSSHVARKNRNLGIWVPRLVVCDLREYIFTLYQEAMHRDKLSASFRDDALIKCQNHDNYTVFSLQRHNKLILMAHN